MAKSVVTPERFARGMTFEQYVTFTGSPENLSREGFGGPNADGGAIGTARRDNSAVFRERYARARLADHQVRAIQWLAAQPNGPAKILVSPSAAAKIWSLIRGPGMRYASPRTTCQLARQSCR